LLFSFVSYYEKIKPTLPEAISYITIGTPPGLIKKSGLASTIFTSPETTQIL